MSKIRMGIVGGGPEAFIGVIHRMAAWLDGEIELVCGAFSRDAQKSKQAGKQLFLQENRVYGNYQKMMEQEAKLAKNERMEFVAIVTPNNTHYPIASMALKNGFHVLCEKPATFNLDESLKLQNQLRESGLLFGLTHTYTGYPIVKEARERVKRGDIGQITKVVAEYTQGWLAAIMGSDDGKQAAWRLDPTYAGVSSCMGDIGVHAANLSEFITGLSITKVLADLGSVEAGRVLDDDGAVFLRFSNGARGVLFSSQISIGEENNLRIRVYGTKGGLEWQQMEPNSLWMKWPHKPAELVRAGQSYLSDVAKENTRTPAGHPEGYIEAFANIYKNFARAVAGERTVTSPQKGIKEIKDVPGIKDALAGMSFIETVVASSKDGCVWKDLKY
jgi:predicted dehydrogenase